jgi:hypothetical protein
MEACRQGRDSKTLAYSVEYHNIFGDFHFSFYLKAFKEYFRTLVSPPQPQKIFSPKLCRDLPIQKFNILRIFENRETQAF